MTPTQVARILIRNRKEGRIPHSLYVLADLYVKPDGTMGCSRSFVTMWMQRKRTSQHFSAWLDRALGVTP